MTEATISSIEPSIVLPLFGAKDQHLRRLREHFAVKIVHRDGQIRVIGDDDDAVSKATEAIEILTHIVRKRGNLTPALFDDTIARVKGESPGISASHSIQVHEVGRQIRPRTPGQAAYIEAIRKNDLVFAVGPAGSGKTYLAVAMAIEALKQQQIRKVVLVRPAVEAGESLGYLPGDMQAKINPYLRPLLDAINEMVGHDQLQRLISQDIIEIVPLAYMRGRTLNESFIILDEAQNSTVSQMKMFLTRMGHDSKIVVSGDATQTDLPRSQQSGLADALRRLGQINGVGTVKLTQADIVRHKLVQKIVDAYDGNSDGLNDSRSSKSKK